MNIHPANLLRSMHALEDGTYHVQSDDMSPNEWWEEMQDAVDSLPEVFHDLVFGGYDLDHNGPVICTKEELVVFATVGESLPHYDHDDLEEDWKDSNWGGNQPILYHKEDCDKNGFCNECGWNNTKKVWRHLQPNDE